jgi:uncharacterized protein (DUF4415 family)
MVRPSRRALRSRQRRRLEGRMVLIQLYESEAEKVVNWFKRKGGGYQTQRNAALREHIGREMQEKAS